MYASNILSKFNAVNGNNKMDDKNIFDEDNALDYIMFEEHENMNNQKHNKNSGCFGLVFICTIPAASCVHYFIKLVS